MDTGLKDKVVVVTGGAGGLGKDFCRAFIEEGAAVVLNDLDGAAALRSAEELASVGGRVLAIPGSVVDKRKAGEMMARTVSEFGRIDVLVNNAGGSLHTPKELEAIEEEDWDLVLDVNLKGTFLCSQAAAPYMKRQRSGRIINMASIGGRTASMVTGVHYAAAKGGVISFTRRLARELGPHGITVNAVAPGFIDSGERLRKLWEMQSGEEQRQTMAAIPLERTGRIGEVTEVVIFLAGAGSSYVTGAVVDINGGRFMG